MDVKIIGERIKQARALRNYTLDDIANEIGVAKSTIQRYENGLISKPKIPILQTIADSLRVNPAWISGQDVPMISEDNLSSILNRRLEEIGMTFEEVAQKSAVSLHWLQNIDNFIPGEPGPDEGYTQITRVAKVIGLPGSTLRAALARQEIPMYEGPTLTAEEAFKQAIDDFNDADEELVSLLSHEEKEHLHKYRAVDDKGKHTVNTVLNMEYNRCISSEESKIIDMKEKDRKAYLEANAASRRTDLSQEDLNDEARNKHDDDIMDDPNF